MDINNAELMLVAAECREAAKEKDFDARLNKCCEAAKDHWMVLDKEKQFKGAMVAAYMESSEEEKKRIEVSLKSLETLGAVLKGLPIDIEQAAKDIEGIDIIPMQQLFQKYWR